MRLLHDSYVGSKGEVLRLARPGEKGLQARWPLGPDSRDPSGCYWAFDKNGDLKIIGNEAGRCIFEWVDGPPPRGRRRGVGRWLALVDWRYVGSSLATAAGVLAAGVLGAAVLARILLS